MLKSEITRNLLAFDKHSNVTAIHDGVVDFFATFDPDICRVLRDNLLRIEDVIAKNS